MKIVQNTDAHKDKVKKSYEVMQYARMRRKLYMANSSRTIYDTVNVGFQLDVMLSAS